ncbi:hypothetical protein J6590_047548 [Homalodisca vitripennis]|nr:hypothetical protein J6590_047548 [Homalodisca vitripennis]
MESSGNGTPLYWMFIKTSTLILSTMPARCAVLRTACSFRKKINSSLQKSNPRSRDAPDALSGIIKFRITRRMTKLSPRSKLNYFQHLLRPVKLRRAVQANTRPQRNRNADDSPNLHARPSPDTDRSFRGYTIVKRSPVGTTDGRNPRGARSLGRTEVTAGFWLSPSLPGLEQSGWSRSSEPIPETITDLTTVSLVQSVNRGLLGICLKLLLATVSLVQSGSR